MRLLYKLLAGDSLVITLGNSIKDKDIIKAIKLFIPVIVNMFNKDINNNLT